MALEPEAASLWCRKQPLAKIRDSTGSTMPLSETGTQYMVVDLGGGTADITVHEKKEDGTLKELHCASGGPWGGTAVDRNFLNLLGTIVGDDLMSRYAQEQTEDMLEREFETKKRTISSQTDGLVTLKVPGSLKDMYEEESGKNIQTAISLSPYNNSLRLVRDKIRLDASVVKDLFGNVATNMVRQIRELFLQSKLKNVSIIRLVGGFAESKLIQDEIEKEFQKKRVLIPEECGLAVVKGAVLFGHTPNIIASRIARYTYGVNCSLPFIRFKHREDYMFEAVDGTRVKKIFEPYVRIGDELPIGLTVSEDFKNVKNKDEITSEIYIYHPPLTRYRLLIMDVACLVHLHTAYLEYLVENHYIWKMKSLKQWYLGTLKFEVTLKKTGEVVFTYFDI